MSSPELAAGGQSKEDSLEGFVFLGVALFITLVRTYSRWDLVGLRGFQADDFIVWFALACFAGDTANMWELQNTYFDFSNSEMTAEARAALDPNSEAFRVRVIGSKLHLVEWFIYGILLWSLKLAVLINVMRLMQGLDGYRMKIRAGFGLIGTTFLIVMLVPFFACVPTKKYWQIHPDPGPSCYAETSPGILWTFLVCNVLTDIYLTVLPMPMLWKTTLPTPTKLALIFLFGCGILVAIAATLRAALVVTNTSDFHHVTLLPIRETFIAILTTNLPSIFVLLRRWLSPFFSFLRTSGRSNKTSGGAALSTHGPAAGPRGPATTSERRGTFVDQLFSRPHGGTTKTEVYSLTRMATSSAADLNGSEERIFPGAEPARGGAGGAGPDGDRPSADGGPTTVTSNSNSNSNSRRGSTGPSQLRLGYSARMIGRGRSRSRSRTGRGAGAGAGAGAVPLAAGGAGPPLGHGITKQVEITIVEERAGQPGPSDGSARGSPVSDAWPFGSSTDVEAASTSTRDHPSRSASPRDVHE